MQVFLTQHTATAHIQNGAVCVQVETPMEETTCSANVNVTAPASPPALTGCVSPAHLTPFMVFTLSLWLQWRISFLVPTWSHNCSGFTKMEDSTSLRFAHGCIAFASQPRLEL